MAKQGSAGAFDGLMLALLKISLRQPMLAHSHQSGAWVMTQLLLWMTLNFCKLRWLPEGTTCQGLIGHKRLEACCAWPVSRTNVS